MLVDFHDQIECDLQEAAAYFTRRDPRVASEFLEIYEECVRTITRFPNAASPRDDGLRRRRIGRFPYSVVYGVYPEFVYIVVIEHLLRRPGYWHERLKDLPP